MKKILLFTVLFIAGSLRLTAQEGLEQILDKLPASSPADLSLQMEQLANLGAPAVVTMSQRLNSLVPGQGDLRERYALAGLAKYLGQGNNPDQRREIEEGFLQSLELGLEVDAEVFLIEQLQYFGSDLSIDRLPAKIGLLCEPVVQTIAQIHTEKALRSLINALAESNGYCKMVLTKAIGSFDQPAALSELVRLSSDQDETVRMAALKSLAHSGSPSAVIPLMSYGQLDAANGNDLLLTLASGLARSGNTRELNPIIERVRSTGSTQQKETAVGLMADHLSEGSRKELVKILTRGSEEEALAVTRSLEKNEAMPMAAYFKSFKKVSAPVKTGLLTAARSRKYQQALPAARELLTSSDPGLQIASIKTISQLSGKQSIPELQKVLTGSSNDDVVQVAIQELSRWVSSENAEVMTNTLQMTSGKSKAEVIEMMGDRGMTQLFSLIEPLLQSADPMVRKSAFNALPGIVRDASVNDLMALVSIAGNEEELESIRSAFRKKARQFDETDQMVLPLLNTFGSSSPALLSKILPAIGGDASLSYIREQTDKKALTDWKYPEAIPDLFALLDANIDRDANFESILRLIRHEALPADQRVLYLRKLMPYATNATEKERIIRLLGSAKSPTSFMYVKSFLADADLNKTAAGTLLNLALPAPGESLGLYGPEIKSGLMQADTILREDADEYSLSFLRKYLSLMPEEGGFVSMFNGKDLTGWQGLVENPLARDSMFSLELRMKQQEADAKLADNWKVENGVITFFGKGYDNLCSVKSFRDFELMVDWKITKDGDSGIYLRGSPQVQIWDPSMTDIGAQVGSGGLYNNEVHESKPLTIADNPVGEWNTFRIIMINDKVTVYLNGVLVTDHVVLENFWNRELPIFREGPIELQAHGTNLQFRDLYVRELPGVPDLPEVEQNAGFKPIFNGINLDGWIGNKTDYVVENGEIVIYPGSSSGNGNLFTEKEYDNFILRFEFKLTPGANNGLGIHAPLGGDVAYAGKEIQILDNTAPIYANLKDYQYHGSVYGLVPASKGALKPVGEWNSQEVTVIGNQIRVELNGQRILFDDLNNATRNGTLDGKEHPGLQRLKGHIGFLGHGTEVRFRNIRIREGLN